MTAGARPTLIAVHCGWLHTGIDPWWPNAAPKAVTADPPAFPPVPADTQNRQLATASNSMVRISTVASAHPLAKSP